METRRKVLVWGETHLLHRLAEALRSSSLLDVETCSHLEGRLILDSYHPGTVVVDGDQVTPEEFEVLLGSGASSFVTLISIDPATYQLTILSTPCGNRSLTCAARVVEILSIVQPHLG